MSRTVLPLPSSSASGNVLGYRTAALSVFSCRPRSARAFGPGGSTTILGAPGKWRSAKRFMALPRRSRWTPPPSLGPAIGRVPPLLSPAWPSRRGRHRQVDPRGGGGGGGHGYRPGGG